MTDHNPAMSFWPLQRQLDGGQPVTDADAREMQAEARRLAAIERQFIVMQASDTDAALARVRAVNARLSSLAADNAIGNLSHAMQIADARHAARREAGE